MDIIKARESRSFKAPAYKIYSILMDVPNYEKWWPSNVKVKVTSHGKEGPGTCIEIRPFGRKGLYARMESVIPYVKIAMLYYEGLYCGHGIWTIEDNREMTTLHYEAELQISSRFFKFLNRIVGIEDIRSSMVRQIFDGLEGYLEKEGRF